MDACRGIIVGLLETRSPQALTDRFRDRLATYLALYPHRLLRER